VQHVVSAADVQPFFFKVHLAPGGYGDYMVAGDITIQNPGFDEQENNDDQAHANDLGTLPFSGFTGNVGFGGSYDGDGDDLYKFQASAGDIVKFTLTPADPTAGLSAYMYDATGNSIGGSSTDINGVVTCKGLILATTPAPYYLDVYSFNLPTDYQIDGALGTYDEVEDNDNDLQANALPSGTVSMFIGNIGSGSGHDYDGDIIDEFSFTSQQGFTPQFDVYFDPATAPSFNGFIRDADGDLIGVGTPQGAGHILIQTTNPIQPQDTAPYYMQFVCPGFTDYWFTGVGGP